MAQRVEGGRCDGSGKSGDGRRSSVVSVVVVDKAPDWLQGRCEARKSAPRHVAETCSMKCGTAVRQALLAASVHVWACVRVCSGEVCGVWYGMQRRRVQSYLSSEMLRQ